MTDPLRFPARLLTGFAWKFGLVLLVVAAVAIASKRYRLHKVRSFCNASLLGITRPELSRRAEDTGLTVVLGESQDKVVTNGVGLGLAWCFIKHDGKHVESVTFASE
jgi:hypothetical protein